MSEREIAAARWKDTYGNRWWRIQNLYKIRDKNRNLARMKLNNIQRYLVAQMEKQFAAGLPLRQLILKYRQGGVSTLFELFYLDDTIFSRNTITGVLAHKKENLGYLFEIPRMAHQYMPPALQPRLGDDSKTSLSFPEINSKMFVSLGIRSTAVHNLHVSEWAFCNDDDIRATISALPPTSNITGETTGNGTGNDFYEKYQESKTVKTGYEPIFIPWFLQEEYRIRTRGAKIIWTEAEHRLAVEAQKYGVEIDDEQILFRRQKDRDLKRMRPQEFPENDIEAFLTSGQKFFDGRKVMVLMAEAKKWEEEPGFAEQSDNWVMFEKPRKGCVYALGADPAQGGDGDYSVFAILNVTDRTCAFRYRARVAVDVFAREIAKRGRQYWNCKVGVERNNHGHSVLLALREIEHYPNIYHEVVKVKVLGLEKQEVKYGWITDNSTRPIMLDMLKVAVEGDSEEDENNFQPQVTILDQALLSEMLTFEEIKGKLQAAEGKHDDVVFAYGIAWQMFLRSGRNLSKGNDNGIQIGGERESGQIDKARRRGHEDD